MPTTLITGASAGLGRVFATLAAKDGHDLVLVARRGAALTSIAAQLSKDHHIKAHVIAFDLAKPHPGQRLMERLTELQVTVDVLINNAGFGQYGVFHEQALPKMSEMVSTNITALMELTHTFLQPMVGRHDGKILQVASTAAFQPGPRMAVYYATKAFVLSFSEAVAHELEGTGVTITALCPGPTRTEFMQVADYKISGVGEMAMMSAADVAAIGYRAMNNGERTVVAGMQNKLGTIGAQILPRSLVLKMSAALTKARE